MQLVKHSHREALCRAIEPNAIDIAFESPTFSCHWAHHIALEWNRAKLYCIWVHTKKMTQSLMMYSMYYNKTFKWLQDHVIGSVIIIGALTEWKWFSLVMCSLTFVYKRSRVPIGFSWSSTHIRMCMCMFLWSLVLCCLCVRIHSCGRVELCGRGLANL